MIRRVCVFCGSSRGTDTKYAQAAESLADELARRRIDLVYGGGNIGLMGILADRMLQHDRHVVGVIPEALRRLEVAHEGLPDLRVVASMHERKALMADLADAFIALPGGLGTIEELFEILTWRQLGIHAKPIGLLEVDDFFQPLLDWVQRSVLGGFIRPEHAALLHATHEARSLLDVLIAAPERARRGTGLSPDQR